MTAMIEANTVKSLAQHTAAPKRRDTMTTTITISNVRPSTCIDIDNTYDVDFVVMRDDGASVAGEATLGWEQQNNQYAPVGDSLDCWMTGKACAALMGDRDAIESIAAEADLAIKRVVR